MAFRGVGERRRLQEYEDLVDQDYDPFHEKCGKEVFFSDKKLIATRGSGYWNGMVFSAKPIPLEGMFQVKLLDKGVDSVGYYVSAQSNSSHTLYILKNAVSYLMCKDQEYRL